jgi:hypothetical protein
MKKCNKNIDIDILLEFELLISIVLFVLRHYLNYLKFKNYLHDTFQVSYRIIRRLCNFMM